MDIILGRGVAWGRIKDGKEKLKEYMESAVIFLLAVMTVSM